MVPQYGVSGYRQTGATSEPGRFILAIEADGASYSSETARDRDRIRQLTWNALVGSFTASGRLNGFETKRPRCS